MTQGDDPSQRFLPRIRQELDKLPLTAEQKGLALDRLPRYFQFLDTNGGKDGSSEHLRFDSRFFDFADKVGAVVDHFAGYGLTMATYIDAAVKHPPLLYLSPEKPISNIETVAVHFADHGLTTTDYLTAAVRHPQLFAQRPETLIRNIEGVVDAFSQNGLDTRAYLKAALREPALFGIRPTTVIAHLRGLAERFANNGLTLDDCVKVALLQPQIFTQSPDTIAGNIEGVVRRFASDGLTMDRYVRCACKSPSLFIHAPETLISNITTVVQRYEADGLSMHGYIEAALKQPLLWTTSPSTVIRHVNTVIRFAEDGLFFPPPHRRNAGLQPTDQTTDATRAAVIAFLLRNPPYMALADENYGVREIHQKLTDGPKDTKLLKRPRYVVERELMRHLGHDDPQRPVPRDEFVAGASQPTEEQAKRFLLRALIHAGYIKGGTLSR